MQGKALALLLSIAAAALLAACGDDSTTSRSTSEQPAAAAGNGVAQLQRFKQRITDLQAERRQKSDGRSPDANRGAAAAPTVVHHDSGGGAAQFRTPGGDNSIQESGVEADPAEMERAAAAFHAYLDLRRTHRWRAACRYLAASLVVTLERAVELSPRQAKPKGCPAILAAMSTAASQRLLGALTKVDVGSLRKNGERGFLLYHGIGGKGYVMQVVEEDGSWKMAALDGTILP